MSMNNDPAWTSSPSGVEAPDVQESWLQWRCDRLGSIFSHQFSILAQRSKVHNLVGAYDLARSILDSVWKLYNWWLWSLKGHFSSLGRHSGPYGPSWRPSDSKWPSSAHKPQIYKFHTSSSIFRARNVGTNQVNNHYFPANLRLF